MNDIYVLNSGMTKKQMSRLRLINGFNFAPIIADAIADLGKDFFQNDDSGGFNGQILYLAISEDIEDRITKVKTSELIEKLIVRLCTETKEQGDVLTETDIANVVKGDRCHDFQLRYKL